MQRHNISFFLDQAYGNIIPSFGIAMELLRRGHKVTYVVKDSFSPLIRSISAVPVVLDFVEIRGELLANIFNLNDHLTYRLPEDKAAKIRHELQRVRTRHALSQLDQLCSEGLPDLIIHDDSIDTAGRDLALRMGIAKIRFATQYIEETRFNSFASDELIVVTVPRFFQRSLELFDADTRFKFVGFIPEGRTLPFRPWQKLTGDHPRVLVTPTSGLAQQIEFCKKIIEIFRDQPWNVILSISASQDKLSAFDSEALDPIPDNVHVNLQSGNFDVLQNVDLFVGQAGQGGTLEAIYWGVPQLLLPPTPYHNSVARRVTELGLGVCLPVSEMRRETLIDHATKLLHDRDTLAKVRAARNSMQDHSGARLAADIIEERLEAKV